MSPPAPPAPPGPDPATLAPVDPLIARFDRSGLTRRYWAIFAVLFAQVVLELFDFLAVAFIMSTVAGQWHLSVAQVTVLLGSSAIGAMVGAATLGRLADRVGRKPVMLVGGVLCTLGCAATGLVPDGGWQLFALLRFVSGVGYGGAGPGIFTLILELTPTRHRTLLSSAIAVAPAVGIIAASLLAARLLQLFGWRGLALAGGVPVLVTLAAWFVVPESFRWLLSVGRSQDARRSAATVMAVDPADLPLPGRAAVPARPDAKGLRTGLYASPRRVALILLTYSLSATALSGVLLWGPTIGTQMLGLSPGHTAMLFVLVGVSGLLGRCTLSISAARIGRRVTGAVAGVAAGLSIIAAGWFGASVGGAIPPLMLCLILGAFFFDGGFANLAPYAGELYPVDRAGAALGLAQVGSGAGKFLGPAILAIVAGSGNIVAPRLVAEVVTPALFVLGALAIVGGLAMAILGIETHGRSLVVEPSAVSPAEG